MRKAKIVIGTSGYQYRDWVGPVYPKGTRSQDMLAEYAQRFRAVEINFTYYGLPKAANMKRMAEATPDDFEFVVKAHRTTTHESKLDDVPALMEGLEPVREAGKLSGVLCQFPWRFRNDKDSRAYLARLAKEFGDVPVFVEFRHESWIRGPVFKFLEASGLLYVSVDEPELPGLVPRTGKLTGPMGYVRFHSRNARNWWKTGGKARYDYDYSDEEMTEWLEAIEEMAGRSDKLFVFFNNCHRGQAAKNAESMKRILQAAGLLD